MAAGYETLWNPKPALSRGLITVASYSVNAATTLGFLAFLVAYYFAFRYGMAFSQKAPSAFWFPDPILLCALLKSRRDLWWLFILATLVIRLGSGFFVDIPAGLLVTSAMIDGARVLATALVLQRFMRNTLRFETFRDFAIFVLLAVILMPVVFAFGGAAVRQTWGGDYWTILSQWAAGDGLAQLVVAPAILYWVFGAAWQSKPFDVKRLAEAALLAAALLLSAYWCA